MFEQLALHFFKLGILLCELKSFLLGFRQIALRSSALCVARECTGFYCFLHNAYSRDFWLAAQHLATRTFVLLAQTIIRLLGNSHRDKCEIIAPNSFSYFYAQPASSRRLHLRPRFRSCRTDRTDSESCLLYTSDAADDLLCVDLGGRRI